MSDDHESLSDKQTAIRMAAVVGFLVVVLLGAVIAAGILA